MVIEIYVNCLYGLYILHTHISGRYKYIPYLLCIICMLYGSKNIILVLQNNSIKKKKTFAILFLVHVTPSFQGNN